MGNISNVRFVYFQTDKTLYEVGPGDTVYVYVTAKIFTDGLEENVTATLIKPSGTENLTLIPSDQGGGYYLYEVPYRLDHHSDGGTYTLTASFADQVPYGKSISFQVIIK